MDRKLLVETFDKWVRDISDMRAIDKVIDIMEDSITSAVNLTQELWKAYQNGTLSVFDENGDAFEINEIILEDFIRLLTTYHIWTIEICDDNALELIRTIFDRYKFDNSVFDTCGWYKWNDISGKWVK